MTSANAEYPRSIRTSIERDLEVVPVVAVMGARQVGKSTLCRQVASDHGFTHRTLDSSDVREQAIDDPEGFLASLGDGGAFIDEVQRAPDLLLAIKEIVDREQRPGRYILSGSNQPKVSAAVSDSLLGRVANRILRPFTLSELRYDEHHPGWSFLFDYDEQAVQDELVLRSASSGALAWRGVVTAGGFPRAVAAPTAYRERLLNDYVTTFSNQDIRELIALDSGARFENFLRLLAARSGQELNYSRISNDAGVPVTTIKRWVDALQRAFILELVPAWSRNASERVIKAPKAYLVDSALAIAAAREATPTGFHFETFVANDLQVWREQAPRRGLFHWRVAQQEVDFVLQEADRLLPLEVKTSAEVSSRDARNLRAFRSGHSNSPRGILLSSDPSIRLLDHGIIAAPFWAVL